MKKSFLIAAFIILTATVIFAQTEKNYKSVSLTAGINKKIEWAQKKQVEPYYGEIDTKGVFKSAYFIWDRKKTFDYYLAINFNSLNSSRSSEMFRWDKNGVLSDSVKLNAHDEFQSSVYISIKLDTLNKVLSYCWHSKDNKEPGGMPTLIKPKVSKGNVMPPVELAYTDGKKGTLESLKGQYVFLDFWSTTCTGCIEELPLVKKLREEIPADKLVIIGMCYDTEEEYNKFIKTHPFGYSNALVSDELLKQLEINSFPTKVLIDPSGKILDTDFNLVNLGSKVKAYVLKNTK